MQNAEANDVGNARYPLRENTFSYVAGIFWVPRGIIDRLGLERVWGSLEKKFWIVAFSYIEDGRKHFAFHRISGDGSLFARGKLPALGFGACI